MKLKPRLSAIAGLVPEGDTVADIGTDHAYIPVFLVKSGKVKRGVASDVRKGPLEKAREVIKRHRLEDRIETRLGDGLEVLKPGKRIRLLWQAWAGCSSGTCLKPERRRWRA
jgi:tRNA (adenine22-N1)-methyltransferase